MLSSRDVASIPGIKPLFEGGAVSRIGSRFRVSQGVKGGTLNEDP